MEDQANIWRVWSGSLEFQSPGWRPPGQRLSWDEETRDSEGRRREHLYLEAPAGHRYRAMRQEQRPKRAPSGRFLRARVSPKNPQNPIGGISMWVAVIFKGCCNRTL